MAVHSQARFMASLGYVVLVAPPLPGEASAEGCRAAGAGGLHSARVKQLDRLVEVVLPLPWIDRRRLFVSGFGEGADAVLDYSHPALRGRVALAPRCRRGVGREAVPTLIMIARHDRWYAAVDGAEAQRRCAAAATDPYTDFFEADGGLHDVLVYTESRVALSYFLVRAAYRPAPPP
jgi:dienelactone hydrolase